MAHLRWLATAALVLACAGSAQAAPPLIALEQPAVYQDGDTAFVDGTGFVPNERVQIGECVLGDPCRSYDSNWVADDDGRIFAKYVVSRRISGSAGPVDCLSAHCAIVAHGAATAAPVELSFANGPLLPELRMELRVSRRLPIQRRTGAVSVEGTLTCNRPALVAFTASVREKGAPVLLDGSSDVNNVVCNAGRNRIGLYVYATGGSYIPGRAKVAIHGQARGAAVSFGTNSARIVASPPLRRARYYVALGDSLAVGFDSPPGRGYVPDLFAHLSPKVRGLTLVDVGCSGATTGSMMTASCSGATRPQLPLAERFLRAHRRALRLITIDIGGNDLVACVRPGGADPACTARALQTVQTNLTTILTRLRRAAGKAVPIVTMTYFDPVLVAWFYGQPGQDQARNSVAIDNQLSDVIRDVYARFGGYVADVQAAFQTSDFTPLPDSAWGPIPVNVERVCRWTDVTCPVPGTSQTGAIFRDDTNESGSQVIADTFAKLITCSPTACAGHAPRASSAARAASGSSAP
jgi:lysophospholipase L1-like esterase